VRLPVPAQQTGARRQAGMKRVYELDVYKQEEALSDVIRHDFDKWNKIECLHRQYKSMKAKFLISTFGDYF
jgi:hypothetical protein